MILSEQIEKITSTKDEYELLYNSDNLYIVWANKGDDNKLLDFDQSIDREYYAWRNKLRGKNKRETKIANADNNHEFFQGYVYSVTKDQMDMFEKVALMPSMKYGYRFDKLDLNSIKEKEKEEIFNKLTEEN